MAVRGYAVRREARGSYLPEGEPLLSLALPGGIHLSSALGVRSHSDPEHEGPRSVGRRLGLAFAISVTHAAGSAPSEFDRLTALRDRQLELPPRLPAAIGLVVQTAFEEHEHRYPSAASFADALADAAAQARIPHGPDVIATTLACLPALPGPGRRRRRSR